MSLGVDQITLPGSLGLGRPVVMDVPALSPWCSCWTATRSSTATSPSPSLSGGSRRWQRLSSTPSTLRQIGWRPARKPKTSSWAMRKVRAYGCRVCPLPTLEMRNRLGFQEPSQGHGQEAAEPGFEQGQGLSLPLSCRLRPGQRLHHARLHVQDGQPLPDPVAAAVLLPVPQQARVAGRGRGPGKDWGWGPGGRGCSWLGLSCALTVPAHPSLLCSRAC